MRSYTQSKKNLHAIKINTHVYYTWTVNQQRHFLEKVFHIYFRLQLLNIFCKGSFWHQNLYCMIFGRTNHYRGGRSKFCSCMQLGLSETNILHILQKKSEQTSKNSNEKFWWRVGRNKYIDGCRGVDNSVPNLELTKDVKEIVDSCIQKPVITIKVTMLKIIVNKSYTFYFQGCKDKC